MSPGITVKIFVASGSELKQERQETIQVVITGRVDMRGNFNWGHWNLVRLEELETEAVAAYLQGKGQAIPGPGRLRDLLGNPMMLPLGECGNDLERHERAARVRDIFCRELHLLVEEEQTLRFLHHDFRDFFAALHVLNEADIGLSQGEIPGVLKQGLLDYFVRRLVGEIEEEHRVKPYLVANEGWKIDFPKYNRLHRVLDLCREKFGAAVGDAVWNIVMIWIEVRGELSGADLTGLDLSGIPLNGVMCSRFYEDRYLAAVFAGSRVHEKNLLPRGHTDSIMPKFKITMPLFKKRAGAV